MKNITRILIALITFTFFANLFFFRIITPFSTALLIFGFCIYVFFVAEHRHTSMWLIGTFCLYSSRVLLVRSAHFVQTQTILAIMTSAAVIWYVSISNAESFGSFTSVFLSPIFAALSYLRRVFSFIKPGTLSTGYKKVVLLFGDKNNHSNKNSTLIGLLIALPIMLILILMFSSADPIYYSYLKNIISPDFIQELPGRIILSCLFFIAIIPYVFPKIRRVFLSPGSVLGRLQMVYEITIVMAVVSVVIASFIVIQWPYVFANVKAETDLSRFGVATYAEYVKAGFIELLRASAFIYALLWIGLTALRQKMQKSKPLFILQGVVLAEFLVILASIARRVYLYQAYHGLTLIRVYGTFFLVWLALMALTLAGRHISNKIRFGYVEGIITLLLVVVLGTWNVESFIVKANPPTVNKRIDYVYLARMSADGVDGWVLAYNHAKQIIEKYAKTTGEIDKNGRREIAYAEYILHKMTNQVYEYETKYATVNEMKTYLTTIINFQSEELNREKAALIEYKKAKPNEGGITDRLNEIEETKKELNKIKIQSLTDASQVVKTDSRYADIYGDIGVPQTLQQFSDSATPFTHSFYMTTINMYGTGNIATRYAKTTTLDHLYNKNVSDQNAFRLMKQLMPLSELHDLQSKYFELYTRIGKQAARDYETDISLDSPLL